MKRVTFHFTERQIQLLQSLSKHTGLAVAEHVRRAIDRYLKEQQQEITDEKEK